MAMEDPPGLLLLEHLNLNVLSYPAAREFYEALGCEQAEVAIHMNCGAHTQFHLPEEEPKQQWRGVITIAYTLDGLTSCRARLEALKASASESNIVLMDEDGALQVQAPWGMFILRQALEEETVLMKLPTTRACTAATIGCGVVGIVEVTLPIAFGTADTLAEFYQQVFKFDVHTIKRESGNCEVLIQGGPSQNSQRIRFIETQSVEPYSGDHMCIYIGDFEGCFERCSAAGILYVNPRFTFLDDSKTLDEARSWQAFRVKDVKHKDQDLLVEEHEIRSRHHKRLSLPRD